jgi:2-polyprenyl-3-methyl-5-hydroxy-6-metoxy-1,4-benzoquinol methylase
MSTWQEKAKDPNVEVVRRERRDLLKRTFHPSPEDRISFISKLVSGRRTLDVGCVTHDASYAAQAEWLHGHVAKAASYCLGLDVLEFEVNSLRAKGYNVLCHDITRLPVGELFEVVVCGEIIEHIGNVDGLFANCKKCLVPGGRLILTTPYPWFLGVTLRHSMTGAYFPGSVDHVTWYDPSNVAELATRHGYELESFAGVVPLPQRAGVGRSLFEGLIRVIRKRWIPFISPLVGCRSLMYVLRAR